MSAEINFSGKRILIIGDVMLDSYIWGKVDRISPEAPVPVVSVTKRDNRLGGAANVALNIHALGSTGVLASVIGQDDKASIFRSLLADNGMPDDGLLGHAERLTTTKFRIIGNNVQMLRVDEETDDVLGEHLSDKFTEHITTMMKQSQFDAVIFEDYDKGVINSGLITAVIHLANEAGIPVLVDPKKRNFMHYKNVTVFKPNLKELRDAMNCELPENIQQLASICEDFRKKQNIRYLLLTLGEKGMLLCHADNHRPDYIHMPSQVRNVADVSGAGDTVIAVAALALALKAGPAEMVGWSNTAAGIVCEYVGVVPVDKARLISTLKKAN